MLFLVLAVSTVLVVSFLCSIAESVLLSLGRPTIESMIRDGKRAGRLMADFKDNIDVPIAAILILNTSAHTVGAAVAGASYTSAVGAGSLWLFSLVFTVAVLLFTEIIPKTLGVTYAPSLATVVAPGVDVLSRALYPLVRASEFISRSLRGNASLRATSDEDIRLMALLGRSEGGLGPRTANMIVGATQLRHLGAADVMLPRGAVRFLHTGMTRKEASDAIRAWGHSRFPVSTSRSFDDVAGIILAKDLLFWLQDHSDEEIDWPTLIRDPLIVPDSMAATGLMRTFQSAQRHLAIVVNEYGEVQGIVTLEDVLEELVGEIIDESDEPLDDIRQRYDGTLVMRGSVDMRRVSSRLGIEPVDDVEAASIGGLVTEVLERIPDIGDTIDWMGYRIEVINADGRRVRTVAVRRSDAGDRKRDTVPTR